MAVSVDKLVKIYVKIRDKRDILRKAYQNEDGELIEHMDKIKDALLKKQLHNSLKKILRIHHRD